MTTPDVDLTLVLKERFPLVMEGLSMTVVDSDLQREIESTQRSDTLLRAAAELETMVNAPVRGMSAAKALAAEWRALAGTL